ASRPTHPLHPYFAPLCARRGYKVAVVAVAHRLCRIMVAMLRHEAEFDVTKLAVERGPFARQRVCLYRRKPAARQAEVPARAPRRAAPSSRPRPLMREAVTPVPSLGREPGKLSGALLPAAKHGATATPHGGMASVGGDSD